MSFRDAFSGNFLASKVMIKRLPSFFFVVFLILLYIFNSFDSQKIFRNILKVEREIQQLKVEATAISVEKNAVTKEENIAREIEKRKININSHIAPPTIIK